jgi:hypothetical protein
MDVACTDESARGTFRTWRIKLTTSVHWGKADIATAQAGPKMTRLANQWHRPFVQLT